MRAPHLRCQAVRRPQLVQGSARIPCHSFELPELARNPQEVLQQRMAVLRRDALGMKLNTMDRMSPMHDAHDDSVICGRRGFNVRRPTFGGDGQRVITSCEKVVVQTAKDTSPRMVNSRYLAVHGFRRPDNACTIDLADRLMTQADTET